MAIPMVRDLNKLKFTRLPSRLPPRLESVHKQPEVGQKIRFRTPPVTYSKLRQQRARPRRCAEVPGRRGAPYDTAVACPTAPVCPRG
eukprot:scaffold89549_cov70-Phaeocystis_antarctica.AAC.1